MKKILWILIIYLLMCNLGFAKDIKNIKIRVEEVKIIFDNTSNKIILSKGIKSEKIEDNIYIYPKNKKLFDNPIGRFVYKIRLFLDKPKYDKIIIGTKNRYSEVDIRFIQGIIIGDIKSKKFELDGMNMLIKGKIDSELIIIDGNYMELIPKNTKIDITGELIGKNCFIDAYKIQSFLKVTGFENIELEGKSINSNIEYVGKSKGKSYFSANGKNGKIKLLLDKNQNLDIEIKKELEKTINYNEK